MHRSSLHINMLYYMLPYIIIILEIHIVWNKTSSDLAAKLPHAFLKYLGFPMSSAKANSILCSEAPLNFRWFLPWSEAKINTCEPRIHDTWIHMTICLWLWRCKTHSSKKCLGDAGIEASVRESHPDSSCGWLPSHLPTFYQTKKASESIWTPPFYRG